MLLLSNFKLSTFLNVLVNLLLLMKFIKIKMGITILFVHGHVYCLNIFLNMVTIKLKPN